MELPATGLAADDVIAELQATRAGDVDWAAGRTFGLVFDGGPGVHDVAERAAALFLHENALNLAAFPSLARIQSDVVGWTAGLFHAPPTAAGFLTSGGTESIQCAVLAARERGRVERGVDRAGDRRRRERPRRVPQVGPPVRPRRPHRRACATTGPPTSTPWPPPSTSARCSSSARRRSIPRASSTTSRPSPPSPPPSTPTATSTPAWAASSCRSPSASGRSVPPWDFRVEGVHSISADVHKLGYSPKGASVILHRTKELRRYQTFRFDGWLGGLYASPNLQGTRSGLPMAAAWAVMRHLGVDGYVELTERTLATADRMRAAIAGVEGLRVLGDGGLHLVAMAADPASRRPARRLRRRRRAGRPRLVPRPPGPARLAALHGQQRQRRPSIEAWAADLGAVAAEVRGRRAEDRSTSYATLE